MRSGRNSLTQKTNFQPDCLPAGPRLLTAIELEPFITPLINAIRIISHISPGAMQSVGGTEAYKWLTSYANNRAHELQSVINGHQPFYDTGMDASERASIISKLPKHTGD